MVASLDIERMFPSAVGARQRGHWLQPAGRGRAGSPAGAASGYGLPRRLLAGQPPDQVDAGLAGSPCLLRALSPLHLGEPEAAWHGATGGVGLVVDDLDELPAGQGERA